MANRKSWRNNLRQGDDGYWHYRFKLKRKEPYEGTTGCPLYRDAVRWLAAYKGRISQGEVGIKVVPTVKIAFLHMVQEKEDRKQNMNRAKRAIEIHVLPNIGHKVADQVTKSDIELILANYLETPSKRIMDQKHERKRTKHGANTLLIYIKSIFNHLIKHKVIDRLPFHVEPFAVGQPYRPFVPIELEPQFFAAIDKYRNLPVMIAVRAMFWMGLREGSALKMRWEGLSWDLKHYTPGTTALDPTKTGNDHAKPTESGLRSLLWAIIWMDYDGVRPLTGWVIPADDGKPHRAQFTKKAIQRAGKAINISGLTPHRMRAGLATNLARLGKNAHYIQKMLDHKRLQTSEHYVMLGQDDLREGLEDLKRRAHKE